MVATYRRTNFRIAEILRWQQKNLLILTPKFQRRPVWEYDARSYLIDTVVRNLPMPKIYLRRVTHPETKLGAYEVVDGQQRLRAIINFHDGTLVLSKRHNPELGDTTFDSLPDSIKRAFLQYDISTELMENATDPEVLAMFVRLNSYTLTLNKQEKLNAKWFGYFKQTCYMLASEQPALDAWRSMRIFSDRQIARMKEVELTSDVLVAIIRGISDITDIPRAYSDYDREFPRRDAVAKLFRRAQSFIASELAEPVRKTNFRRKTWFYSLMVAVADSLAGITHGDGPKEIRPPKEVERRMFALDSALRTLEPPPVLADLKQALSRATSHVPQRRIRHEHFFAMLTLSESAWRTHLSERAGS